MRLEDGAIAKRTTLTGSEYRAAMKSSGRSSRGRPTLKLAAVAASLVFAVDGCDLIGPDSPTTFTQAAPVQIAGNGDKIVFKSPGESNNAPLRGGPVTFSSVGGRDDGTRIAFSYLPSKRLPRNDVMTLSVGTENLMIDGRGRFRVGPPAAAASWHVLPKAFRTSIISITGERGRYLIEARTADRRTLFYGTIVPEHGIVYLTHATFSTVFPTYAGSSQHDVGNWGDADDAAASLARVESTIPK